MPKLDLTDKIFTRLTAREPVGRDKHGGVLWRCECECGNSIVVSAVRLQSENVKSCGCLKREEAARKQKLATAAVIRDGTSKNILSHVVASNTGVRGVYYNKKSRKYEASLRLRGKYVLRQNFDTLSEAVDVRKKAEDKYLQPLAEKWLVKFL